MGISTKIERNPFDTREVQVDILANIANCTPVDLRKASGAVVFIPAGSAITELSIYGCSTEDGTYQLMNDDENQPLTREFIQNSGQRLPVLLGCKWVKLVGNDAGTITLDAVG